MAVKWDKPERLILATADIPDLRQRLEIWLLRHTCSDRLAALKASVIASSRGASAPLFFFTPNAGCTELWRALLLLHLPLLAQAQPSALLIDARRGLVTRQTRTPRPVARAGGAIRGSLGSLSR